MGEEKRNQVENPVNGSVRSIFMHADEVDMGLVFLWGSQELLLMDSLLGCLCFSLLRC